MNLMAADVIVLRNSTRIDAKILEVSDTEIKYKKANNLNGPTFTQRVDGISAIIYENGDVTSYADQAPAQSSIQQNSQASNASPEKTTDAHKENKSKLQFNPQPSDNYWCGITVGYMSKNMKATYRGQVEQGAFILGTETGKTYTPAMRVGLTMNPTFKYGIGLKTGIFMEYGRDVLKGAAETSSGDDADLIGHDITLSVPLQLSYRYEIIPKLNVMLYTGPVFDFGAYCTVTYNGNTHNENLYAYDWNTSNSGYSGFNCLWGIGASVQWDRLRLDVGGDFGMVNKSPSGKSATLNWNKPVYVTLTCFF